MAFVLDLILSIIVGAAVLLTVIGANDIAVENYTLYNGNMMVQEMLISTAHAVEGEFRNMGFGLPQQVASVILADTSTISFLMARDRDATIIDTITYTLGDTSELRSTQNELDRFLHRRVNTVYTGKIGVVTMFRLRYFAQSGLEIPTPVAADRLTEIHVVEVTMEVQNPYATARRPGEVGVGERTALYSSSMWQQTRLASQNTRR